MILHLEGLRRNSNVTNWSCKFLSPRLQPSIIFILMTRFDFQFSYFLWYHQWLLFRALLHFLYKWMCLRMCPTLRWTKPYNIYFCILKLCMYIFRINSHQQLPCQNGNKVTEISILFYHIIVFRKVWIF